MKPGEHPEFFRFPAPEGRSRESTLHLDREGHFHHDGERVAHPKLAEALHTWIARHPDDGRFILTNGYDWTYFTVEDVPYFVRSVRREEADTGTEAVLVLSDGTEERLEPSTVRVGEGGALYLEVKREQKGGPFAAKMTRHAQAQLEPFLSSEDGTPVLATRRGRVRLPA